MQRARTETDKNRRRELLLTAALDEFYERGFAAARMEDIARRAALSKGTLYLYFESKDDLFRALIQQHAVPNIASIEAMSHAAPSFESALGAIASFAPQLIRHSQLPKLMKVLAADSHNFPDVIQSYRTEVIERGLSAIANALERAAASGEIQVEDAPLMARLVIAPMVLSMLWQALFAETDDEPIDLERLFAMHAANLKRALVRPEHSA